MASKPPSHYLHRFSVAGNRRTVAIQRRGASACSECHRRKIACSNDPGSCVACLKADKPCQYGNEDVQTSTNRSARSGKRRQSATSSRQSDNASENRQRSCNGEGSSTQLSSDSPSSELSLEQDDSSSVQNDLFGSAIPDDIQQHAGLSRQIQSSPISTHAEAHQSASSITATLQEQTSAPSPAMSLEEVMYIGFVGEHFTLVRPSNNKLLAILSELQDRLASLDEYPKDFLYAVHNPSLLTLVQSIVDKFSFLNMSICCLGIEQQTESTLATGALGMYGSSPIGQYLFVCLNLAQAQVQHFLRTLHQLKTAVGLNGLQTTVTEQISRMRDIQQNIGNQKQRMID